MTAPDDSSGGDKDVFAGLSRTRPQRPSSRRKPQGKPAAAKTKAKAKPAATTAKATRPAAAKPKAKPAPKAAPRETPIPRSGYATPDPTRPTGGADAVGAAVQAVAELAKSLLGRLPRP